jgi:hypothetical protein
VSQLHIGITTNTCKLKALSRKFFFKNHSFLQQKLKANVVVLQKKKKKKPTRVSVLKIKSLQFTGVGGYTYMQL